MVATLTRIRSRSEVRTATPLLDGKAPGATLEADARHVEDDLDAIASILNLHASSTRTLKYTDDLQVVGGKKRGLWELAQDLQAAADALAALSTWIGDLVTEHPDLETAITEIAEDVVTAALQGRRQSATVHLTNSSELVNADPAIHEVAIAQTASNESQFTVLAVYEIEAVEQHSLFVLLSWTSQMNSATGLTKWMLSEAAESAGSPPSGSAVDVTDAVFSSSSKDTHSRSGTVPAAAIPSGTFRLLLCGKPDAPGDVLTASLLNESKVELSY